MNTLLPKSELEFSELNYWERFFKNRSKSFDWYGEYTLLFELFQKYVKLQDEILVVGCGNSTLSHDLYATQKCLRVCSIDISKTAIEQMTSKHKNIICKISNKLNKAFDFKCTDVCKFSSDDDIKKLLPMTCIIDKGTTDAIHSGGESSDQIIMNMWTEINLNLAVMGRYMLITLAQSHIVDSIIEFFLKQNGNNWMVNVHEITSNTLKDQRFSLPIFAFVFYKMKSSPSLPLVYVEENSFSKQNFQTKPDKKLTKIRTEQLKEWISSRQQLSVLSHSIQESNESEYVINMQSSKSKLVRFHCIVVRNKSLNKKTNQLPYCVFIVPFGFNDSDIVTDKLARLKLCKNHLKCRVCLFVYLNPREYYENRQVIQDELNSVAVKFCPVDVPDNYAIPYVSCHDFIYNSKIKNFGDNFLEYLETPNGLHTRFILSSSDLPVIVADKPVTVRDQLIAKYIELLPNVINGDCGLYCGQASCITLLDKRWKLFIPGLGNQVSNVITNNFHVNCVDSVESSEKINWLIYDSFSLDLELIQHLLRNLSDYGIAILCYEESENINSIFKDLLFEVLFSCTTIERFGGDKTHFCIVSKNASNSNLLQECYNNLCC